jgi:hypothetical protein
MSFFLSYCSPLMVQASTTTNSATTTTPTQLPLATNSTPLSSSTNTRVGSGGDGAPLNRSAPDRKTIHSTFPSRQHHTASGDQRASTRNPNSSTMGFSDGNNRHQQQAGGASSMMGGTGSGAQSFLSKLSSKFARR